MRLVLVMKLDSAVNWTAQLGNWGGREDHKEVSDLGSQNRWTCGLEVGRGRRPKRRCTFRSGSSVSPEWHTHGVFTRKAARPPPLEQQQRTFIKEQQILTPQP